LADAGARLDLRRTLSEHALAGEPSAAIVSSVALTSPLARAAQVEVERPALSLVTPDVAVDRLVAD